MNNENFQIDEYEKSLSTTYRRDLWSRFVKGLKEYKLLSPGDKVCVCISGGKDSMCLAKLFMLLTRHSDFDFDVHFLVMNPGYNKKNYDLIKENIEKLHIPATFIDTEIFEIANAITCNNEQGKRYSNGPAEGLNNPIKTIVKDANGYNNFERFCKRILLILNKRKDLSL